MQLQLSFLLIFALLVVIVRGDLGTTVNIRIEGETNTIYESRIFTCGHNVTTQLGGTHHCDGTNLNSNPRPGPTATSALDDASKLGHFTWDGTYSTQFDDFFITRIGPDQQTATQFWGILVNFNFTQGGGCQTRVHLNDKVLFAFDAFNKQYFLKLTGSLTAIRGQSTTFTVTDGSTGIPISGAQVDGQTSDSNGKVHITFTSIGLKSLKAERSDSVRSNALDVVVF